MAYACKIQFIFLKSINLFITLIYFDYIKYPFCSNDIKKPIKINK